MTATAIARRPDRAETNRRNALKSTGPRSKEGKDRSRLNAVKHGMTAKTLVLPGEDARKVQIRLEAWTSDFRPQNEVEQYLVEQAVQSSWMLDRARRAELARLAHQIESVPRAEALRQQDVVAALGSWLVSDRDVMGDPRLRSELLNVLVPDQKRTYPDCRVVDIPNTPEAIVRRLETNAAGCQWLIDHWAGLRAKLDKGNAWSFEDKAKALRLLGRRPLNMEPQKWEIYLQERTDGVLGAVAFEGEAANLELGLGENADDAPLPLDELADLEVDAQLDERLSARRPKTLTILREIVEKAVARLETIASDNRRREHAEAARQVDMLAFDDSAAGELLRRYQFSCSRSMFRSIDTLVKVRRSGIATPEDGETSAAENPGATEANPEPGDDNAAVTPEIAESDNAGREPSPALPAAGPVQPAVDHEHSPSERVAAPAPDANPPIESTRPEVADVARTRLPLLRTLISALALLMFSGAAIRSPGHPQDQPRIVPNGPAQIRQTEPAGHVARTQPRPPGITRGPSADRRNPRNEARCQNGSPSIAEYPAQSGDPGRVRGIERPSDEHFRCWPREPGG